MIDQCLDRLLRPRPHARRPVHVDFPVWMIEALDAEAGRLGVTRQALVKLWIAERLESGGGNARSTVHPPAASAAQDGAGHANSGRSPS